MRPFRPLLPVLMGLGFLVVASAEPRFRADDGNLWHTNDNPALPAVSGDVFSLGYAAESDQGWWSQPVNDLKVISPLFSFQYAWRGSDTKLSLGTAMGPWQGFSLGYRGDSASSGGTQQTAYNFGMIWRPWDLVSAGITLDDAFGTNRLWGAGLAVRPFTLFQPGGDGLTLTGDVSWTPAQWNWERWGARWSWQGSDVRVWYEPASGTPGVEVTLALGASETTGSATRLGQAFRWSSRTPELSVFGPVILRLRGMGTLQASPEPPQLFSFGPKRWDLPGFKALLDRAVLDPLVVAVVIENPPEVEGLAAAEDLRDAIDRLHKAGKKVYIQADSFDDSLGFQGWIAAADRVVLDPSGSLNLVAGHSRRLYLKGFLDKIGVEFVNFAPWDTKSFYNTLTSPSMPDGERAMLKRYLTDRDELAAAALASGRGHRLKGDAAALVAQGPYLVAQEALDAGLIDATESQATFEESLGATHPGVPVVETLPLRRTPGWGPPITRRTVALVHLAGDVIQTAGQAGQSIGKATVELLQTLRADNEIRAIVLRVDSPGGAVLPSAAIADEVKKTVAAGKLVVVVMGDVAASGGYYLSAPASRIFAEPGTLTGSIGVTAAMVTAPKALDLLGIKADGVDLAPSGAFGDWTRPLSDRDRQKWNGQIDATYRRFVAEVAEGRHLDPDKVEPLARGQVYTGREALALGLVDELGGQREARAWLEKQLGGRLDWREYIPGDNDFLGGLLDPLATAALRSSHSPTLRLAQSLDQWAAPWSEAIEGVVARGPGPLVWIDAP